LLIQQLHLLKMLLHFWVEQQLLLLLLFLLEQLRPQLSLLQLHLLLPPNTLHSKAARQDARLLLLQVLLLQGQLLKLQLFQLVWQQLTVGVGCCLQPLTHCLCCCTGACICAALEC
jgi:hypothetical protein